MHLRAVVTSGLAPRIGSRRGWRVTATPRGVETDVVTLAVGLAGRRARVSREHLLSSDNADGPELTSGNVTSIEALADNSGKGLTDGTGGGVELAKLERG